MCCGIEAKELQNSSYINVVRIGNLEVIGNGTERHFDKSYGHRHKSIGYKHKKEERS